MFGIYYVGSTMLLSVAMLTEISLIVLTINNIDMQFRDTVMQLMRDVDPDGVKSRAKRKLKQWAYRSKVDIG